MRSPSSLRIGTRKSALALAQAEMVRAGIMALFPEVNVELVPMLTTGDIRTDRSLSDIGGKGLFTKELEEALAGRRIDCAVHSLKDMETRLKDGFMLAAMLPREDARDALIAPGADNIAALKPGARIGTSSLRRTALLKLIRPDVTVVPFRGNVNTRLSKLAGGEVDATLLAVAGLIRIGREEVITQRLSEAQFIPAVGQGTIAIECRRDDEATLAMLTPLNHAPTWIASLAERSLLARLDGSCRTPIAGYARLQGEKLIMSALIAKPDGSAHVRAEHEGHASDAQAIGMYLAETLLARGGGACLS